MLLDDDIREIFKEGKTKPENVYFLARGKYISRVTKYLTQNNISNNPVIMSREQANKTWAKSLGIKFDVFDENPQHQDRKDACRKIPKMYIDTKMYDIHQDIGLIREISL